MVYLFKNSDNPIDNLIDQLTKAGWTTKLASSGYFTKYKWPNLVFSGDRIRYFDLPFDWETEIYKEVEDKRNDDFENEIDEDDYTHDEKEFRNCIELMGCYRFKCNNQYKEGEVVIYYEKIYRVALNYCSNHKKWKGVELEHSINLLRDIIMYHESIHWLMHWVKSASGRYIPHIYNSRDTVMFHEAFAQLFTHLYVQNNDGRKEIFDWLLTKQPPQYLAHDNLLKAGVDSEEKAIIVLEILRRSKIQSYDHTLDFLYSTCYLSTSGTIISIMDGFEEWTRNGNSANTFIDDFFTTKFTPGFKTI